MVSLEQVKLLETKVAKAIEYVRKVDGENTFLQEKLAAYQKRIDELEDLVQRFKDDQSRIEEGIVSALERLNQFEDAIEKGLAGIGDEEADRPGRTSAQTAAPAEAGHSPSLPENEPPAADTVPEDDESDEAIMAILEAEEEAARVASETADDSAGAEKTGPENPPAELDIF